jgi:HTH-type transcriptional regulator / antitoxin HigA
VEVNLKHIAAHWNALHEALGLGRPIKSKAEHAQALAFVEQVFDAGLADGPLGGLLSVLADRIREYEARKHPWPDTATPADVLAALMHEHGLRQGDLPEVGSQGVVSEVLAGKRVLNLRQVQALANRFGVPMEVFAD